jgi:quinol monooxygenase YgiN
MITLIAHVRVRPEKAAAFEALISEICAKVRAHEPEVAYYAFSKSVDEPHSYVVIEVYADAAAHAAHMARNWIRDSLPRSVAMMAGAPDIRQYVSPGSEPIRLRMRPPV